MLLSVSGEGKLSWYALLTSSMISYARRRRLFLPLEGRLSASMTSLTSFACSSLTWERGKVTEGTERGREMY